MLYFQHPFLTLELHSEFPGGICGGPKLFFSRNPTVQCCRRFCGVHIVAACYDGIVLCWWQVQKHLPYISKDAHIYLCRTVVSKVACLILVQACHSFRAVLVFFFFCQSFAVAEQFLIWREQKSFFSGVYIYVLMECGLSALLNVNLSFTAKQVTT